MKEPRDDVRVDPAVPRQLRATADHLGKLLALLGPKSPPQLARPVEVGHVGGLVRLLRTALTIAAVSLEQQLVRYRTAADSPKRRKRRPVREEE